MVDIEALAKTQHAIWSHWMRWFFENDTPENRERWRRQMATDYEDLSEREKESDRRVVVEHGLDALVALAEERSLDRVEQRLMGLRGDSDGIAVPPWLDRAVAIVREERERLARR